MHGGVFVTVECAGSTRALSAPSAKERCHSKGGCETYPRPRPSHTVDWVACVPVSEESQKLDDAASGVMHSDEERPNFARTHDGADGRPRVLPLWSSAERLGAFFAQHFVDRIVIFSSVFRSLVDRGVELLQPAHLALPSHLPKRDRAHASE
jgi:hypothetical protein